MGWPDLVQRCETYIVARVCGSKPGAALTYKKPYLSCYCTACIPYACVPLVSYPGGLRPC